MVVIWPALWADDYKKWIAYSYMWTPVWLILSPWSEYRFIMGIKDQMKDGLFVLNLQIYLKSSLLWVSVTASMVKDNKNLQRCCHFPV